MIVTVTPNAAVDRTLAVPNFQVGRRSRASEAISQPGGKGVNVARALKAMGSPVVATGFAGGDNGARIVEGLTHEGILNDFVRIEGSSRTSTAVIDITNGTHTEINEYGPRVTEAELQVLLDKLSYLSQVAEVIVLAGSLPRDVDPDLYQRLVRLLRERAIYTALDTQGEPLRLALAANPSLVTPNQREAESLVGHEFNERDDYLTALDDIARRGAQNVIITCNDGCYARMRSGREVEYYEVMIEPVSVTAAIGSGDVFMAGYVRAMIAEQSLQDCLRYAVAAGAANTQLLGAARFRVPDIDRFFELTRLEQLSAVPAG